VWHQVGHFLDAFHAFDAFKRVHQLCNSVFISGDAKSDDGHWESLGEARAGYVQVQRNPLPAKDG
jgi:hypothetical protein